MYKLQFGKIGYKTYIKNPLKLNGKRQIFMGDHVVVSDLSWLEANNKNTRLSIGDGSCIGNFNHIYCLNEIAIGKKVLTADKVYITDNSHHYEDTETPIIDQLIKPLQKVHIGDGAWIGENVCIIGASVGKGSVIGANSVVTKDIPDYSIAVGSPAIVIKQFDSETKKWKKV
jgi:acetyltransferase-like isoleucine patch superfamily enzyme